MNLTMRLTRMIAIAVALAPLCAPADMPKGLFRGQMVSWEGSPAKGVLLARNASGIVEGCGYDSMSFLELSRQRITVAKLEPGDPLEIITDHKPGSRDCYIRMLQVIPPGAASQPRETFRGVPANPGFAARRPYDLGRYHPARRAVDHAPHPRRRTDGAAAEGHSLCGRWIPAGRQRRAGQYARLCARRPKPVRRHRSLPGDVGRDRRGSVATREI